MPIRSLRVYSWSKWTPFLSDDFKIKSRAIPTLIWIIDSKGKKKQVNIDQKQISKKYDDKAKIDRANAIDKTKNMIFKCASIPYSSTYRHIKNNFVDPDIVEILNDYNFITLNTGEILEEEKYDR